MSDLIGKTVNASQVASFYKEYPKYWFLLEVLGRGKDGKAEVMKVITYDFEKDVLREFLLDSLPDANGQYIFVYADPDGKCDL